MTRFWKFIISLFIIQVLLSFIYAIPVLYGVYNLIWILIVGGNTPLPLPLSAFVEASLIPALFMSFSQLFIIAMLMKKSLERSKKIMVKDLLQVTAGFFLVTTIVLILQIIAYIIISSSSFWVMIAAFNVISNIGWLTFPIAWGLYYMYLLKKFKLKGAPVNEDDFEFEAGNAGEK